MKELLQKLEESCTQYVNEELDDAGFRQVIDDIPAEVWQDQQSAMTIVKALVENEDLYEVSLRKRKGWAEFVCNLLPDSFWEIKENILGAARIVRDFMEKECEGVSCFDMERVFAHITPTLWDDDHFASAVANLVFERAYSMYDLDCISDLIPESVWKNENELCWVVRRLYNEDERNMGNLSLFPKKSWESAEVIFEIISCLQYALDNDRAWGTAYGNFRGDNKYYLDDFLHYVPSKFKSDKNFVLELLEYDSFSDAFSVIYDWMEPQLWSDKEFVMEVLEKDCEAVIYVPDNLADDQEFRAFIDENVELAWVESHYPQDKIPQWIKDWTK